MESLRAVRRRSWGHRGRVTVLLVVASFAFVGGCANLDADRACDAAFSDWIRVWEKLGAEGERQDRLPVDPPLPLDRQLEILANRMDYEQQSLGLRNATFQACSRKELLSANNRLLVLRPGDDQRSRFLREASVDEWCRAEPDLAASPGCRG